MRIRRALCVGDLRLRAVRRTVNAKIVNSPLDICLNNQDSKLPEVSLLT